MTLLFRISELLLLHPWHWICAMNACHADIIMASSRLIQSHPNSPAPYPIPFSKPSLPAHQPTSISLPSPGAAPTERFSRTNLTNSSNTPGQAPSSLHQPISSSSKHFFANTPVWSHISLLTLFFHFVSRYSMNHSKKGVVGVFQDTEGAVKRRLQYVTASSRTRNFCPDERAIRKVCL